ncbi:MAG: radical SAM protein [Promethearchaeota archaeon]
MPDESDEIIQAAHKWRSYLFELPDIVFKGTNGIQCKVCANECCIPEGEQGYCGLRMNQKGRLVQKVSATRALLHYYLDPHITNCCGSYFCPGGTGAGYPKWSMRSNSEYGFSNLAVFFYGCSLDCLFCQNVSHKQIAQGTTITSDKLLNVIENNSKISCICYFGGSPEPQLPFTIRFMETCKNHFEQRILRQCVEMNGHGNPSLMKKMGKLVEESGGIIKFDLKAFSDPIYRALCGNSRNAIFDNFSMLADTLPFEKRRYPPLMATTLLVPYYVDEYEVTEIARFLKNLNQPSIEYSLLIFHPHHLMRDLPVTPLKQVQRCYNAAKQVLGKPPHVGNIGLLNGRLEL